MVTSPLIVVDLWGCEKGAAKYISFRSLDKDRFMRGSAKSLGKEYTKEHIRERIERNLSELKHKIAVKAEAGKSAKQSVVELEHRIKDLAEIIKYAQQYKDNRSYHIGYKKAKDPDAYFRRYESQIILYDGARRMMEQAGRKQENLNQYLGKDMPTTQDIKSKQKSL